MNIFICIKDVPDTESKIQLKESGAIDYSALKWIMNPYDEFALEEALLFKAQSPEAKLFAIRVGEAHESDSLKTALALGVDEAIIVKAPTELGPFQTAKLLVEAIQSTKLTPDLIFMGKESIDQTNHQVPQLVASMLKIPSITDVHTMSVTLPITLSREDEQGSTETLEISLPAVISCNKGLNKPRIPTLPGIMKAKKKMIQTIEGALLLSDNSKQIPQIILPKEKEKGIQIKTEVLTAKGATTELLNYLQSNNKLF